MAGIPEDAAPIDVISTESGLQYKTAGLMTCEWSFVAANLIPLAHANGNGFVAATRNWTGVTVVDVEEEDGEVVFPIEAWGVFVRRWHCSQRTP
ncbi:hypothetical protein [Amycolatopsis taiwanensis]|uniref:hypothetical protein n=1 Tax=Amycolatopsis taiwanensis TaxID=342230 RepID=UPI000488C159|nr:hypothetical protein [Amycolatopsis taiwanensis]